MKKIFLDTNFKRNSFYKIFILVALKITLKNQIGLKY